MFNTGYHAEARGLARRMVRIFGEYETIVTPSASCAAMIRQHYPSLFEDGSDDRIQAEALAKRSYEFVEYLVKVQDVDLQALGVTWQGKATYHYSCHLRDLGTGDHSQQLIGQILSMDYQPLSQPQQCCGFGGTFAVKYPQISTAMVRDKIADIRATGARTLVCNEAGCSINIAGACRRDGLKIRTKSLAEIIAEGLGLLEPEGEL